MCSAVMMMKAIATAIAWAVADRDRPGQHVEERRDQMRERRLADPAERQRGDGDAELGRGEIGVEMVDRALSSVWAFAPPVGDELGDAAAAHRHQREFGGDEEAVGGHEDEHRPDADEVGQIGAGLPVNHDLLSVARPAPLEGGHDRGREAARPAKALQRAAAGLRSSRGP